MRHPVVAFLMIFLPSLIYGQNFKQDSLYFSQKLEPYRRLLDSVASKEDWPKLINLSKTRQNLPTTQNSPAQFSYDTMVWLEYSKKERIIINNLKLIPAKYTADKISTVDSSEILFIETDFDLKNRNELAYLQNIHMKEKNGYKKISSLLKYIYALHQTYSSNSTIIYSRSQTIRKYLAYLYDLLKKAPHDIRTANWLINTAKTLNHISPRDLYKDIYSLYIEAETILLAPFQNRGNKIQYDPNHNDYEEYVKSRKITKQVIDIYSGLVDILNSQNKGGTNNQLYPILKTITRYRFYLAEILEVGLKEDKRWENRLQVCEEDIIMDLSLKSIDKNSQYQKELIDDRIKVLEHYMTRLLDQQDLKLTSRRQSILYFTLGVMFDKNLEEKYAMKAYWKVLDVAISSNLELEPEFIEFLYYQIYGIHRQKSILWRVTPQDEKDLQNIIGLYNITNNYEKLSKLNPAPIYYKLQNINFSRYLSIYGFIDSSKNILLSYKKSLFKDSFNILNDPVGLELIYKELYDNKWLEISPNEPDFEKTADSIMMTALNKELTDVFYGSSSNIPEEYYNMNKTVDDSRWAYNVAELNDEIQTKTEKIDKLNSEQKLLLKSNQSLSEAIEKKNEVLSNLTNKIDSLKLANLSLAASNQNLRMESDKLAKKISEQKETIGIWTKIGFTTIVLAVLLPLIVGYKGIKKQKAITDKYKSEADRIAKENEENNYKLKLEKRIEEGKLLAHLAEEHDIDRFIKKLPELAETINDQNKIDLIGKFNNFSDYYKLNSATRGLFNNTIVNELNIAKKAAELYTALSVKNFPFTISNNLDANNEVQNIEIPKRLISSLIANSIRHGSNGKDRIDIALDISSFENGYTIKIEDNGCGFEELGLEKKQSNSGINLLLKQVASYNEHDNPFVIDFSEKSVKSKGEGAGVIVEFNLSKNEKTKHSNS